MKWYDMEPYKTFYKAVGMPEWRLIRADGACGFPECMLRHRLYFPALFFERACCFARDWHTKDRFSEFAGLVLAYPVRRDFLSEYEVREAAGEDDLWLALEQNRQLNKNLLGKIRVCEVFYGAGFDGPRYTPLELSDEAMLL